MVNLPTTDWTCTPANGKETEGYVHIDFKGSKVQIHRFTNIKKRINDISRKRFNHRIMENHSFSSGTT